MGRGGEGRGVSPRKRPRFTINRGERKLVKTNPPPIESIVLHIGSNLDRGKGTNGGVREGGKETEGID